MPQTSLIKAYNTNLQYTIPRNCMCFTIISLVLSYPTTPIDKAKITCSLVWGIESFLYT